MRLSRGRLTGSALTSRVAQWTQAGLIQRIQPVAITMTAGNATGTATITGISIRDSILLFQGSTYSAIDTDSASSLSRIVLTNATTVTATRTATNNQTTSTGLIIELVPGVIKSVQYDTVTVAGVFSNTKTITTVNTLKTSIFPLGASTTDVSGSAATWLAGLTLTNATTVTATRASNNGVSTVFGFLAVELF